MFDQQVVLESFLQAQKISVRKALQRSFRKYVTYGEDCNLLLMHQLQNLIAETEKLKAVSSLVLFIFVGLTSWNFLSLFT
jgi:DNA replication licensing factor MCM2